MSLIIESFGGNGTLAIVKGNDLFGLEVGAKLYTEAEMKRVIDKNTMLTAQLSKMDQVRPPAPCAVPPATPLHDLIAQVRQMEETGLILDAHKIGTRFLEVMGLTPDDGLGVKQERYKNSDGNDTIDKWAERYSLETFRTIMWIQMEKYNDRLGKKDEVVNEVRKIADYAARWLQVEEGKL